MIQLFFLFILIIVLGCGKDKVPEGDKKEKIVDSSKKTEQKHSINPSEKIEVNKPNEPPLDFGKVRDEFFRGVEAETGTQLRGFDEIDIIIGFRSCMKKKLN